MEIVAVVDRPVVRSGFGPGSTAAVGVADIVVGFVAGRIVLGLPVMGVVSFRTIAENRPTPPSI